MDTNTKDDKQSQRPLDPTRSGGDFVGDTTGMTGITTGSAQQTSATPQDKPKDENKDHLPGGILETSDKSTDDQVVPREAVNDEEYKKNVQKGMSDVAAAVAEDIATEEDAEDKTSQQPQEDKSPSISAGAAIGDLRDPHAPASSSTVNHDAASAGVNVKDAAGDDSPGSDEVNTETAPYQQPYNKGEQSASGTTPDPTSDDDTQANAHGVGEQLGENEDQENPQEVSLADDIDAAEEHIRTH